MGDKVRAFGLDGVVQPFHPQAYLLYAQFEGKHHLDAFYPDGRRERWHKEPSLVLVERPKKKKKIKDKINRWVNVYYIKNALSFSVCYDCKESADSMAVSDRLACVKLTGDYEIEVENNE